VLLLAATAVTTTANGARFMSNFVLGIPPIAQDADLWPWPWLVAHPALFRTGWVFSGSLLGILLIHEFGHYFACRLHRIRSTLPFVLPAPTLSGTAGAIIRIQSRIPTRNALMDVGIYGPLAGYLASALAIAAGFVLSRPLAANAPEAIVRFGGEPLTLRILHAMLAHSNSGTPTFANMAVHPLLLAGWIGLFITSLNLIPGGQLDGGHILYAISPRLHRVSTRLLPLVLLIAGVFCWAGWILWGLILLLPAMRHPKTPIDSSLTPARVFLGITGLILFALTFTPTPFYDNSLIDFIHAFWVSAA
jgi:membrane-associated protease RseP (regulator of RpoE activity)